MKLHIKDITTDGKITDLGKGAIDFTRVVAAGRASDPLLHLGITPTTRPAQGPAKIAYDFMHCSRRSACA